MNITQFVPSVTHVVASGIDVSNDLLLNENHSISTLLKEQDEKEKTTPNTNN